MVTGWLALVYTLGQWTRLGFGRGLVGGMYLLTRLRRRADGHKRAGYTPWLLEC